VSEPFEQWVEQLLRAYDEEEKMTDKQLRIISAAIEVFAEKGYAASSTSEIAQRAAVAEGTIFRHYKTKKDLLLSIVAPTISKLMVPFVLRDFTKVLEAEYVEFKDFIRAALINRAEFVRKHLPVIKIVLQEIPFHAELRAQFFDTVAREASKRIVPVIEKFQKTGQVVAIPPMTALRLVVTTAIGFLLARYMLLPDHDWNDEQEIDYTIDFILHGLSPTGRAQH